MDSILNFNIMDTIIQEISLMIEDVVILII